MNLTESGRVDKQDPEWGRGRTANVRLALLLGGVAVLVFMLALWKFRPF